MVKYWASAGGENIRLRQRVRIRGRNKVKERDFTKGFIGGLPSFI
jgi:hypothetical protein